MSAGNVKRFKSREITPHAVVNWLFDELLNIEEIYVVIKDKEGNYVEAVKGDAGGAAYAALIIQQIAVETL
jgi:hypothetical protein